MKFRGIKTHSELRISDFSQGILETNIQNKRAPIINTLNIHF